ncbi:MAG: EAL domain-containing protein [Snowella sp.]|nr:EAL domain-containing protein [Snowella sp.]
MLLKFHSLFDQLRLFLQAAKENPSKSWKPCYDWRSLLVITSISGLVAGSVGWTKSQGRLQFLELLAYDAWVQLQPQQPLDNRLLVVGITEQDIRNQKRWPLSDAVVAELLTNLQQHQPKVIALDLFRDIPHQPGHEQLQTVLKADNIIVANQLAAPNGEKGVVAPAGVPPERIGFVDLVIDADNVVRRGLIAVASRSGKKYPSLALQTSLRYLADYPIKPVFTDQRLQLGKAYFNRLQVNSGAYQLPPSEVAGWQTLMRFRSPAIAKTVSLTDVLKNQVNPQWINNRIILIGVTAPSGKDTFPTPYSSGQTKDFEMPGVIIHAQLVSQILGAALGGEQQFWFWNSGQEWLWLGFWSFLGAILTCRLKRLLTFGLSLAIAVIVLWLLCGFAFLQAGWIPFVAPLLGLLLSSGSMLAYKVVYQAYHDPLTGLPNRRLFLQSLQSYYQHSPQSPLIAVLFLDLDRFKIINDGLGHDAGDAVLIEIAQRLRTCLKSPYLLARVGGDEFAICLANLQHSDEVIQVADRIQQVLSRPCFWQEKEICVTVSIGIAFDQLRRTPDPPELLRYADIAMYHAKSMGKARHEIFIKGMDTKAIVRWQLETDLRMGLSHDQFELYYQPIVSLKTLRVEGFEALIRWRSLDRGLVSPSDFISVAEESGLIVPLGHWILQQACEQIQRWRQQFPQIPSLLMSVNLSGRQFSQPDLIQKIRNTLQRFQLTGKELKLEITESMIINDVERAIALLHELKTLGIQLSIDDFGTGYSSLSYLYRFPVDTLKIDKSFISYIGEEPDHAKYTQLVHTIITLGHNLGMSIVAEGIENPEQLRILRSLNCEYGQGYFFAQPLLRDKATELLTYHHDPHWTMA